MDQGKLAKLRQRYAGAGGGDIHHPHFAKVAAAQFTGDKRKWPFADVATFVGAPYRPDALTTPGLSRPVTCAAQTTEPRSFHNRIRSSSLMPRAFASSGLTRATK